MPRPTAAQFVYGSCTVVLSTIAMLLLSQTSSGVGVAVIALAALGLGLLVAVTVPLPRGARPSRGRRRSGRLRAADEDTGTASGPDAGGERPGTAATSVTHPEGRRVRVP